ncbi:MAG: hypothetical protein JJ971_14515 [Balneolaceae bacterium]|nr:hypothetical protein [Balneolaceae bacterium]MBO6547610.1 hypothetical protein [Balneolaceae bacterium]MBO6648121.1 hypothetical protein [Balneolaceae bacterium]
MKRSFFQFIIYTLAFITFVFVGCVNDSGPDPSNPDEIEEFIVETYKSKLGLEVPFPTYTYTEQNSRYTSTVYLNNTLHRLYVFENGSVSLETSFPIMPMGEIKVLNIIVDYPQLEIDDSFNSQWNSAIHSINQDHIEYSEENNLDAPIVQFSAMNIYVAPSEIPDPIPFDGLKSIADSYDINRSSYDLIALIDLDQENPSGGFAVRKNDWVKIGWFYSPDDGLELDPEKFRGIAYAVYHHEIGHLFGWDHEWSDAEVGQILITEPALFGWTDSDNDGVIEINDSDPYGIQ